MSNIPADEDEKPLDPAVERVRRKMVRLLVISVSIMMIGLMSVLGSIVYKLYWRADKPTVETVQEKSNNLPMVASRFVGGDIDIPNGSTVVAASVSQQAIVITLKLSNGNPQIMIVDPATSKIIATYSLK